MRFEWNDAKAQQNVRKHRVSFEQAEEVFNDPRAVPFEDLEHSTDQETRYVMIGMSSMGLLFVSFAYGDELIRLISARRAEKWMVQLYEDKN